MGKREKKKNEVGGLIFFPDFSALSTRIVLKTGSNTISGNILIHMMLFFFKVNLGRTVDRFRGTWKSIPCENFEEYMKELGEPCLLAYHGQ